MNGRENGISVSGVDNVISAFEEYKADIETFLKQIADNQEYTKAYKGFEQNVRDFVNEVCDTVRLDIMNRINNTVEALRQARDQYTNQKDVISNEIRNKKSKFSFEGK